ncbi:MAG TPA: PAS domain S-box protein [Planctomycetia bacterium]|nr:PAS domain S-box protein [Planctomycetia bacterium]
MGERDLIREQAAALAESQARMGAILEAAVEAIISIDERGIIETVNPSTERLFGYAAAEMVGRNVSMLMPAPYRAEHDGYLSRFRETGEKRIIGIGREVTAVRKSGEKFPVDLSVAEARTGERRFFVGVIRDITDRKRSDEALRESNEQLAGAMTQLEAKHEELRVTTQQLWQAAKLASVGELAASIAHELNNPLATVSLRIESVLAQTPPDDARRRGLEIIDQETRRMADLVANLLQFARRGHEQSSTVDVRREVTKAVELVQHQFRKRLIDVAQEFEEDVPLIFADRQKLSQVFLNLLTNAVDAMTEGGTMTLRIAADRTDDGRAAVRLEFVDTGAGIAPEHLATVMEPFFTTKEEGKGTGLGLAICRRIINEHGGSIAIDSAPGRGTAVRVTLPAENGGNVELLYERPAERSSGGRRS